MSPEHDVPDLAARVKRHLRERGRSALVGGSAIAALSLIRGAQVLGIGFTLGLAIASAVVSVVALWAGVRIAHARRQRMAPPGVSLTAKATLSAAEMRGFLVREERHRGDQTPILSGDFQLTSNGMTWRPSSWLERRGVSGITVDRNLIRSVTLQPFPGIVAGTAVEVHLIDGRKAYLYLRGPRQEEVAQAFAAVDLPTEP